MEGKITIDQIGTQSMYDLVKMCDNNDSDEDLSDSPFATLDNSCDYYDPSGVKDILTKEPNNISLFCLNCQGLRSHWDSFHNLIWKTCGDSNAFDIIVITELFSMNKDECALNGYYPLEFRTRDDTNSSRGGVGLYIRDKYNYELRTDLSVFIPHVFESIFIELHINKKSILVGVIYRPNTPPKADIDIFTHTMHDIQNILSRDKKETLIMGDMNIDLLKCTTHVKSQEYIDNSFSQGFIPLITKPTRVTDYTATLIDHLLYNRHDRRTQSGILVSDISDHYGIFSIIQHSNKVHMSGNTTYRSFNEAIIDQSASCQLFPNYYAPGDDSPHGGILLLLCPYVCMYVCMYVRVWLKFLVKVFG